MSCDDNHEDANVSQVNKQNFISLLDEIDQEFNLNKNLVQPQDSEMPEEGEMDLSCLVIFPPMKNPLENTLIPKVMVEESAESEEVPAVSPKKEKLVNSLKSVSFKSTLANHPDIYKNKRIQKFQVDPNSKFNYSKYNEETEL